MTKHCKGVSVMAGVALLAAAGLAAAAVHTGTVKLVDDGDTFRLAQDVLGRGTVRLVGIDSPEGAQHPWGGAAKDNLKALLPKNSTVLLETDVQEADNSNRLLAHVTNSAGVLTQQDQLTKGLAVLFAVWPNTQSRFLQYRQYQIAARQADAGMWPAVNSGAMPLPFVARNEPWTVGDFFTHKYVPPADYAKVHVNNRVFFFTQSDALAAGYSPCPQVGGVYDPTCFSPSGE